MIEFGHLELIFQILILFYIINDRQHPLNVLWGSHIHIIVKTEVIKCPFTSYFFSWLGTWLYLLMLPSLSWSHKFIKFRIFLDKFFFFFFVCGSLITTIDPVYYPSLLQTKDVEHLYICFGRRDARRNKKLHMPS